MGKIREYFKKENISNLSKNPYNFLFLGLILFILSVNFYYFFYTLNQPLWWDESEYIILAEKFIHYPVNYQFTPVRQILFSLIDAGFLLISKSEFFPRFLILLLSLGATFSTYLLGKEIYNKKVGAIAALFMAIFPLGIFFTSRILVDVPSLAFFSFSAYFFFRYFKNNSIISLYFGAITIAIGVLFKLNTVTFLFAIAIYILITEQFKFLKKKEIWIAALIFLLILSPYLIWGYVQFHGFVITMAGAYNAPKPGTFFSNGITNIFSYLHSFPNYLSFPLLILCIFGFISLYKLILGFDLIIKNKDFELNKQLYLLLLFIVPLIVTSFSLGYTEDRYILSIFPSLFIMASSFLYFLSGFFNNKYKKIILIIIVILIVSIVYLQIKSAKINVDGKLDSYGDLKRAGLWLKDNSDPNVTIITASVYQVAYYSERQTIGIADNRTLFEDNIKKFKPKFLIISVFERHPDWIYSYPQEKNMTIVDAYFTDSTKKQPSLVVYKL
jgi:4-amino-4-deoxy-L-arabinose transferase-like glycosyltransferase